VPHFESKHRIEQLLRQAVAATFVRPTFFMETLRLMIQRDGDVTRLAMPLPGDVAVQMISVRDIGRVAAAEVGADQHGAADDRRRGQPLRQVVVKLPVGGLLPEHRDAVPTARAVLAAFTDLHATYTAGGPVLDRLTPVQRLNLAHLDLPIPWPETPTTTTTFKSTNLNPRSCGKRA
jgi:hypothetical protein